jgi:hypothetical protein
VTKATWPARSMVGSGVEATSIRACNHMARSGSKMNGR